MIRLLGVFAAFVGAVVVAAEPRPLLVIQERDPWRMVMGSDSAKFVLYDDGSIIYLRSEPIPGDPFARRTVADAKAQVEKLLGFDIATAEDNYELTWTTDQVTTTVWTPAKQIRIYGNWRERPARGDREQWATLPAELRQALTRIEEQREAEGKPWLPESIEVMLWPYGNAPQESIVWPAAWPGLDAPTTLNRENLYLVFMPSELLPDLQKFLAARKRKGAVLIGGKKMSAAYRFPFVGEQAWMP
ncbi:hypothetical protein Pla123a_03770 [Posidoniimonas polymericola]|uniref:Uncharacterized protein n=1 Tax=Posidoniimonas polymericola TaxID=2528002 RepID=A0A5C5ZEL1_9BACT|nr:hypothetical protein [Posidoniimonas polymericola]TWT85570.1 hypothetical protein Pla123a_03770 [Posidoniimonas polymericola]